VNIVDPLQLLKQNEKEIQSRFCVKRIGIFGSYARHEERGDSDVDVYVEFSEPTYDNFIELFVYLEGLFGKTVELVTKNGVSPHMSSYIDQGVVWCE
jgi:hypothetical protein